MLAAGNQNGKVYIWDIDVDDPTQARLLMAFFITVHSSDRQYCFCPSFFLSAHYNS